MCRNHPSGRVALTEDEFGTQLARMNLTRLLIDIPDDRHWVVGGDYLLRTEKVYTHLRTSTVECPNSIK